MPTKNPKIRSAILRRYWLKNKEKIIAYRSREDIKAKACERTRLWRLAHPGYTKAYARSKSEDLKKYRQENHATYNANAAKRRFVKAQAMPSWVDRKSINKIYLEAKRKTISEGVPHHVDHIWPLQGEGFVGLHVPWNLQILTATANHSKGNRVQI